MDRIGRYKILSELGRGAMGIVYRAEDPKIGRQVAIKTLKLTDKADDSEIAGLRERLMREAQSAGRLSHPGIVTVYDVGEDNGVAYIAMEFVEGRTFESYLRESLMQDLSFGAEVLLQAAAALDYAHSKEIVHRDIKPANLMVTANNVTKIMDFGIARISSSQLTQTGTVMGTPSYMSPEQVRGQGLDGRSDQFSLGVIAYELLTGKKPFAGDNLTAVIFKIVSAKPAKVTDLCPWLVPHVDQVMVRALAKKPEDRYATCRALAESFQAAVEGVIVPEGAEAVTAPGLDPVVTQGIARETGAANAETQISTASNDTTEAQVIDEPLKLLPIDRSVRAEPEKEEPSGIRTFAWAAGITAAAVLAFSGAVEATAGGILADPVNATQQAWAIWFGSPTEEAAEDTPATVDESGIVFGEAEPADEPEPDTTVVEVESVPATEEVALAQEAASVTEPDVAAVEPEAVASVEEAPESTPPPVEAAPAPPPKRVAPRTASVYFRTTPPGVTIVVDDRAEWTCRTPCTLPNLTVGRRTVVARRAGFQTTRRTIAAGSEPEMIVEIGLEDARVQLLLSSQPDGADIYIDGRLIPQKTNAKIPLPEGTYRIRVSKDGVGEAEQVVQVNRQSLPFAQFILEGTAP
jgi:predicted Ser/Thr protein kinase